MWYIILSDTDPNSWNRQTMVGQFVRTYSEEEFDLYIANDRIIIRGFRVLIREPRIKISLIITYLSRTVRPSDGDIISSWDFLGTIGTMLGFLSISAESFRAMTVPSVALIILLIDQQSQNRIIRLLSIKDFVLRTRPMKITCMNFQQKRCCRIIENYHEIYSSVLTAVIYDVTAHFKSIKIKNTLSWVLLFREYERRRIKILLSAAIENKSVQILSRTVQLRKSGVDKK